VLRIVTLMCLFAPLGKMIYESDAIRLDPRPITEPIHRTGDWALIFLFVALADLCISDRLLTGHHRRARESSGRYPGRPGRRFHRLRVG
jgi:DMSO/TMAO reductase YedYZ heme-binding membrane subunit